MQENRFPLDWIETLKRKSDIISVVSKYIPLNKRGNIYWARCPFHHEKTPSFAINEMEQYYHCFGCGVGGDVIKFVSEMESCSRWDSIKLLAEQAQMELPNIIQNENIAEMKKEKDKLQKALNTAREFYKNFLYLKTSVVPQEYIKRRGLNKKDLDRFQIGYSPNSYSLIKHMQEKGFDIETLKKAGIIAVGENSLYDFLTERLIFPINNSYGDCIAYSGRILDNSDRAKYKNTSQTMLFDKSKAIFAIDLLKEYKQKNKLNYIIIVEGQMDVIALHHHGFENTVACLGTALTEKHNSELKRFCENIVLCFDGDEAGNKATMRSIEILKEGGLNVRIVDLPEKLDPDEYIKKYGREKFSNLLENALAVTDYKLKKEKEKFNLIKTDEKANYVKNAISIINELGSSSEKEIYLSMLSKETKIQIDILRRDIQISNITNIKTENKNVVLINKEDGNIKAVKYVIYLIMNNNELTKKFNGYNIEKYIQNPIYNKIYCLVKNSDDIKNTPLIFENLSEEEEIIFNNILDFNEKIIDEESYYLECIRNIVKNYLTQEKAMLAAEYSYSEDEEEKKNIRDKINKNIINAQKIKNLEEFFNVK